MSAFFIFCLDRQKSICYSDFVMKFNSNGQPARTEQSMKSINSLNHSAPQHTLSRSQKGRTAYFLDVDNLCGTGLAPKHQVEAALISVRAKFQPSKDDQIYCAATAKAAFYCKQYWPNCSVRVGRGDDGSDICLLNDADPKWLSQRFERVVIASADGIFAGLATELQKLGVKVVIAASSQKVSHKLRAVAPVVVLSISAPAQYVSHDQFNLFAREAK